MLEVPAQQQEVKAEPVWLAPCSRPPSQNQPKQLPPDDNGPLQLPARIHIKLPSQTPDGKCHHLYGILLYTDANYGELRFSYGSFANLPAGMFMKFPDPDILRETGQTKWLTFYRSTAAYQRLRKSKQGKGLEAICFSDKLIKNADPNVETRPDSHYYNLLDYARPGVGFIQDPTFTKEMRDALALEARKLYIRGKFVVVLSELEEEAKRQQQREAVKKKKPAEEKKKEQVGTRRKAAPPDGSRRTKRSRPSFEDVRMQTRMEVIDELNSVKPLNIIHRAIALYSSFWKEAPVFSTNIEALQLVEIRFQQDGPWKNFSIGKGDAHDQWTKALCAWMLMLPKEDSPPSVERVSQLLDVLMGKVSAVSALPPLA
jgi:hypothetical protein